MGRSRRGRLDTRDDLHISFCISAGVGFAHFAQPLYTNYRVMFSRSNRQIDGQRTSSFFDIAISIAFTNASLTLVKRPLYSSNR